MDTPMLHLRRYGLALGLLSMAIITFELALIQVFSITQWYHFAYMVISVAMLGFGTAGTFLAFYEKRLLQRFDQVFPILLFLCGISMSLVVGLSNLDAVRFDTYLLLNDHRQAGRLVLTYLLLFLPFFFGALAIGLAFVRFSLWIGRLYFADLLGSGLGGLLAIGLLWHVPPWQVPALAAILPVLAGGLSLRRQTSLPAKAIGGLALAIGVLAIAFPPRIQLSQYKSLSKTLLLPEAEVQHEHNSPYGWLEVVASPALRYAPALSLNYQGPVPVRKAMFNNGDWIGSVVPAPAPDSAYILDFTTGALPYFIRRPTRVLALKAGTGEQAAHALAHRVNRIDLVEANPALLGLLQQDLAAETDSLFFQPALMAHELEARTFLYTASSTYDLIVLPTISTFGGTSGLNALQEQYELTTEAFRQMWHHLTPNGMISVSCWMDYPVRNPLKILATMAEVLELEGRTDKKAHLIAIRSWSDITFVLKKRPFTAEEVQAIRYFCGERFFDPALLPGLQPGERQQYNQWQDSLLFGYMDAILSPQREAFYKDYNFNVRPATDNRPYFSQFLRWQSLPALLELWGSQSLPFLEAGYLIVLLTFVQILVIALIFIILPLFRLGFRGGRKRWIFLYFSGLGLGYMFVEIVLIQQFILFFGHPIYATAAVISLLLIASGLGSLYSEKWKGLRQKLWLAPGLIVLVLLGYLALFPFILKATIGLPGAIKLMALFLLTAPIGFIMGLPFPTGIRFLADKEQATIPWAWGVNGYLSVISTALATIIAVELGFWWVMALAAGAYLIASVSSISVRQ